MVFQATCLRIAVRTLGPFNILRFLPINSFPPKTEQNFYINLNVNKDQTISTLQLVTTEQATGLYHVGDFY